VNANRISRPTTAGADSQAVAKRRRSALHTGLQILDCVAERGQMRAAEIAEALQLPISTMHRYVRLLRETGHLYEVDGYYCLGHRLSAGASRRGAGHLVRVADPLLRRLTELTGEAAILTVRVATTALCLDRIMPPRRYLLSFQRGSVRPLYAGASATVLLAYAPPDVIAAVTGGVLRRFTTNTPNASTLPERLARIRDQGFAVSHGEVDPRMVSVAAAAFRGNVCVCGLSVAGPEERLSASALDRAIDAVVTASRKLGERLRSVDGAAAWIPGEMTTAVAGDAP
jgi:DNA-binding IclR family transcriptional regulator